MATRSKKAPKAPDAEVPEVQQDPHKDEGDNADAPKTIRMVRSELDEQGKPRKGPLTADVALTEVALWEQSNQGWVREE